MNRKFGPVTVAMTTFPARWEYSIRVVHSLAGQCDFMKICLNQFDSIPQALQDVQELYGNVDIVLANGKNGMEDLGCLNKMRFLPGCDGYYLTVDDDIVYPPNYVEKLTSAIDMYDGRAVCSYHGTKYATMNGVVWPDDEHRKLFVFSKKLSSDTRTHTIGMGVGGCVPKRIGMKWDWYSGYPKNQGDDEITAMHCWKNGIPMMCIHRPNLWLAPVGIQGRYSLSSDKSSKQKRYVFMRENIPFSKLDDGFSVTYITDETRNNNIELCCSMLSCIVNGGVRKFNILVSNLLPETESFLNRCKSKYELCINIVKIPYDILHRCKEYNAKTVEKKFASASSTALAKYEICNLVTDSETLYLDTDTIVLKDISHLKEMLDSSQHSLFAVEDPFRRHCSPSICPYAKELDYFNSGVLLMNLNDFRKNGFSEMLWKAKKETLDNRLTDQNGFNMVFHGSVKILPRIYNEPTSNPKIDLNNAVVLHFIGAKHKFYREEDKSNKCLPMMKVFLEEASRFFPDYKNDKKVEINEEPPTIDNNKHDAVFVLGSGSCHQDLELLIALYSINKFCSSWLRNIYIVGSKPMCSINEFDNVIFIGCKDPFKSKDANIIYKVQHLIQEIPELSDDFLLCSDDQLVVRKASWEDFRPRYVREFSSDDKAFEDLCKKQSSNKWLMNLYNTLSQFVGKRDKIYYYEPHIWSPINKGSFMKMCKEFNYVNNPSIIFSLYYNYINFQSPRKVDNEVVFYARQEIDWAKVFRRHSDAKFIGYNDAAFRSDAFKFQLVNLLR